VDEGINLLIVGGAGAVGSALINGLGEKPAIVLDRVKTLKVSGKIGYLKCRLEDLGEIDAVGTHCPDHLHIVYLAGSVGPFGSGKEINSALKDNVIAISNFLNMFKKKISHFTYLSSVSVYGKPIYNPIDEEHPIQPFSIYGASKASAEMIAKVLCEQYGIGLTIIRATQLFGVSSTPSALPNLLLTKMREGVLPKPIGNLEVKRDYLHVNDLINLLIKVIEKPVAGVYNAGSGKSIEIIELFRLCSKHLGKAFESDFYLAGQNIKGAFDQVMNISKARQIFGFRPDYTISQWLAKSHLKKSPHKGKVV